MFAQDQILNFLKTSGPTLPAKVAKTIKSEVLIASAHLADLVSQGKVKLSFLKVGGSPLYFLSGQEYQLYDFVQGNVNPKDLAILDELKAKKILREENLELLAKVALRNLKDFAIPLQVRFKDQTELFWKWHLLPDEETNKLIANILTPPTEPQQQPAESSASAFGKEISETQKEPTINAIPSKPEEIAEEKKAPKKKRWEKINKEVAPGEIISDKKEKQKKLEEEIKTELPEQPSTGINHNPFYSDVEKFLHELEISIQESLLIRKNAEISLLVSVPSVVGKIKYFCKAKKKSRCDEKELSIAYLEAQMKKLPLLFLHTGALSKKAQEMIEANAFENAVVKKIV